jgi:tyrosine-specific transport protein
MGPFIVVFILTENFCFVYRSLLPALSLPKGCKFLNLGHNLGIIIRAFTSDILMVKYNNMSAKDLFKNYFYPIAVFSGGIIGVGFFSLPYIAMKAGIWVMLAYFIILTALIVSVHLIFAQISLKTPDFKRFPGFVGHYLGKRGEAIALFATIIGTYGVLLAYLIIGSEFLKNIFQPYFGGSAILYTLIYFSVVSLIVWLGINVIAKAEFWILCFLFLSIIFIFVKGFLLIKLGNFPVAPSSLDWKNLFLPYGPVMFSLWGVGLIPEVEEMVIGNKGSIKKVIIFATVIPVIFYLLFTFLILSITGFQTTESAFIGLKNFFGAGPMIIIFLAGMFTTITAFITQGLTLRKVFAYDLKINDSQAFIITCSVPLILLLMGVNAFIPLLSFVGGFLLGIDGILILLMYKKIGGKNIIIYPLSLIFLAGIIYEIVYFIK